MSAPAVLMEGIDKSFGPVHANRGASLEVVKARRLALPEFVGHLPGRRSKLGTSWATEAHLTNNVVLINYHLTAEIQNGDGGYKTDPAHRLRVMRHKREKRRLGRRARALHRRGRVVYLIGDGNFDGIQFGRFTSCWEGNEDKPGTLGWRKPDCVHTTRSASSVATFRTRSDHRALAAYYRP